MIIFKKLRYKNLLSTGNAWTAIDLNRSPTTLIVGENGAGKSTMLDALSFALFGRPFRGVNKGQLVNSINGKGMVVEVEFSINRNEYEVRRGIKPGLFEIYMNGSLINQDSTTREYQQLLEKYILKLNHKSFSQIVVIGSTSFVPFMQLPAQHRRDVIEDLLDIEIFTTMNLLLRDKISTNKAAIQAADHNIALNEQKVEIHKRHIETLRTNNEQLIQAKRDKIEEQRSKIEEAGAAMRETNLRINDLRKHMNEMSSTIDKRDRLLGFERKMEDMISRLDKELEFFNHNDTCPKCHQDIEPDFKHRTVEKVTNKQSELRQGMEKLDEQMVQVSNQIAEIERINGEIAELTKQVDQHMFTMQTCHSWIGELEQEIEVLKSNAQSIDTNNEELEEIQRELEQSVAQRDELSKDRNALEMASVLLKDGGIKSKIIKQYVPIINKLINKYLAAMDFFVNFELDENFNESIKSRYRDEFSYASFSEGEKLRIDIALLFTWRAIAKLRNSTSTNLLIMDEIFDSSLDTNGTDEFLKILQSISGDTNIFIISHKADQLYDKFHSVIKFEKHKNFSRIAA